MNEKWSASPYCGHSDRAHRANLKSAADQRYWSEGAMYWVSAVMAVVILIVSFLPCERGETQPVLWFFAGIFFAIPLGHLIAEYCTNSMFGE